MGQTLFLAENQHPFELPPLHFFIKLTIIFLQTEMKCFNPLIFIDGFVRLSSKHKLHRAYSTSLPSEIYFRNFFILRSLSVLSKHCMYL